MTTSKPAGAGSRLVLSVLRLASAVLRRMRKKPKASAEQTAETPPKAEGDHG